MSKSYIKNKQEAVTWKNEFFINRNVKASEVKWAHEAKRREERRPKALRRARQCYTRELAARSVAF